MLLTLQESELRIKDLLAFIAHPLLFLELLDMEILGIDIGGTGIKGAIVDTVEGKLVTDRHRIPTPQPATPQAVIQTVNEIIGHFEWEGLVGCGFPAVVVHDVIRTASNIDRSWIGVNAAEEIKKMTFGELNLSSLIQF